MPIYEYACPDADTDSSICASELLPRFSSRHRSIHIEECLRGRRDVVWCDRAFKQGNDVRAVSMSIRFKSSSAISSKKCGIANSHSPASTGVKAPGTIWESFRRIVGATFHFYFA